MQLFTEVPFQGLPPGTYTVQVASDVDLNLSVSSENNNQWTTTYSYSQPEVSLTTASATASPTLLVSLAGVVQPSLESQSTFSIYIDNDNQDYDGIVLQENISYGSNGPSPVTLDLSDLLPVEYYLYATVNDGFNPTVFSEYSSAVQVQPPLGGTVTNAMTTNALSGIAVWIDNPSNPDGVYEPAVYDSTTGELISGDYSVTTNSAGFYSFAGPTPNTSFQNGRTYAVGVVVGDGFELPSGESDTFAFAFGTGGGECTTCDVNFTLNEFSYVSGVVFNDQNNNGIRDNNEPGIPNVTVALGPPSIAPSVADWESAIEASFPLHWYRFNDDGVTAVDSGRASADGAYENGTEVVAGWLDGAASFDGVDDQISLSGEDLGFVWTAEFVLRKRDSEPNRLINGPDTALKLNQFNTPGEVGYSRFSGLGKGDYTFASNYEAPLNENVTLAFVGNTVATHAISLYANGQLVGVNNEQAKLELGSISYFAESANMLLDELVIFDRPLTLAELAAHAAASQGAFQPTATTLTNDSGEYTFHSLDTGTQYEVALPSSTNPGYTNWNSVTHTVTPTGEYDGFDNQNFPVAVPVPFGGTVKGFPVSGGSTATPLNGWTVTATGTDANGVLGSETATSGADGSYEFTRLLAGDYTVEEVVQPGWFEVSPGQAEQQWASGFGIDAGALPVSADVADFDGDGHPDLVVGRNDARIDVFWGPLDSSSDSSSYDTTSYSPAQVVAADVTGDGKPDIVTTAVDSNNDVVALVRINAGGRSFALAETFWYTRSLDDDQYLGKNMVVADYDQDGNDDLSFIIQPPGNSKVVTLQSTGSTFNEIRFEGTSSGGLAVGDLDGNGHPDNVYWKNHGTRDANLTIDYVSVDGNGNVNFDEQWITYDFSDNDTFNNIGLGDIDDDGYLDVVVDYQRTSDNNPVLGYWLNNSSRSTFLATNELPTAIASTGGFSVPNVMVEDFNADGHADVARYFSGSDAEVFYNFGSPDYFTGSFDAPSSAPAGGSPVFMTSADVDLNGLPDLLFVSNAGNNEVSVVLSEFAAVTPGYDVQTTDSTQPLITSPAAPTSLTPDFVNHQFTQVPSAATAITGKVIDDLDGDGGRDPEDVGREGATVVLEIDGGCRSSTLTDGDGAFSLPLADVPDGIHRLSIRPIPGRAITGPKAESYEVIVRNGSLQRAVGRIDFFTTINEPPLITDLAADPVVAGELFQLTASFTDLDTPKRSHTATVD